MNGRMLDANNDIYVVTGSDGKSHVARAETKRQRTMRLLGTVLHTFQGECFTDYEAGVPWFDSVLGNSVLFTDEISQEIKEKILAVDGVSEVLNISVTVDGRNISGRYRVRLDDGSTETGTI